MHNQDSNTNGPIILIEDDTDDHNFFLTAFRNLKYPNEVLFFTNGEEALAFLNKTHLTPFLILSDINMPKIDGLALRAMVRTNELLDHKCIPYLFFSTASDRKIVTEAYKLSVQGFFMKQNSISELEKTISVIMEYWKRCIAPNDF
ncbi:MAG: response regulator [Sediminibacterium sp.]